MKTQPLIEETAACKKCRKLISEFAVFPQGICVDCHAEKFDANVKANGGRLPKPDFSNVVRGQK